MSSKAVIKSLEEVTKENVAKYLGILNTDMEERCQKIKAEIEDTKGNFQQIIKLLEKWRDEATGFSKVLFEKMNGLPLDIAKSFQYWYASYKEGNIQH